MAQQYNACCSVLKSRCSTPLTVVLLAILQLLSALPVAHAGLYSASDHVLVLDADNLERTVLNSSNAWLVQFYVSWCGHCIKFSDTWKSIANDIKEWKPALSLAVLDCGEEANKETCSKLGVHGYPSLRFFKAFSKSSSDEISTLESDSVQSLRHRIIDLMEKHEEVWPPACPPLEPISVLEVNNFFTTNNPLYLALIFEGEDSYIGREVTLDMLPYENIAVRRVLKSEQALVAHFEVTSFPSCYLYFKNNSHVRVNIQMEVRSFYTYYLKTLPGVMRGSYKLHVMPDSKPDVTEPWKPFESSKVYMADLESAIHYSLRVEVGLQRVLAGEQLLALKSFVSVLAKYFPGRTPVRRILMTLNTWLKADENDKIPYSDFEDVLNNKIEVPNAVLSDRVNWVACQGSKPQFRGFPCSLWTLFHFLTVQAAAKERPGSTVSDPLEVLRAMRGYIKNFFSCRECAKNFEAMAVESMETVKDHDEAILWLWSRHNRANNRLAGDVSEDPKFPKLQWPPLDLCAECHNEVNGEHAWNMDAVLQFLKEHYSINNLSGDYLERKSELLNRQKQKLAIWKKEEEERARNLAREIKDKEVDEENKQYKDYEVGNEENGQNEENNEPEEEHEVLDKPRSKKNLKASIIKGKMKISEEDIVDLDTFVEQHYKSQALQAAAAAVAMAEVTKKKSLTKRDEKRKPLQLQLEEDEIIDYVGIHERLKKRGVGGKYLVEEESPKKQYWKRVLGKGFSRLDLSLCALLYFVSSVFLLVLFLFFRMRRRCRRVRHVFPVL
ncbi:sulfhydryl oxidase 1 [Protopterus annectens]|uniref:sulfhydryl oxidase 1 n=1 Tax=Protopterus annectens TaxID=7888 RepID=UPI001CFB870C|nr:sulfhydryl oxidase 1 [Protopterus annectens]